MSLPRKLLTLGAETKMDVLRKTAAILSENFGVQVYFQGSHAYTDGKVIVVPSLPEDAPDDLVEAIIGYIDHEVGHVLFTDFSERRPHTDPDKRVKDVTNAIEDIRQEHCMAEAYRGAGLNLEFTSAWTLKRIIANYEREGDYFPPLNKFLLLAMARAKSFEGHVVAAEFYDKVGGDMKDFVEMFDDEIRQWVTLPDVSASYEHAKELLRRLDELAAVESPEDYDPMKPEGSSVMPGEPGEPCEPGEEGSAPASGVDGSDGTTAKGDEEGDDSSSSGAGDDSDEEGDEASGSGSGGDEDGDAAGSDDKDGDGAAGGGADDKDASASGDGAENGEKPAERKRDEYVERVAAEISKSKSNPKFGLHETMAREIGDVSTGVSGHRAFTTRYDVSGVPVGKSSLDEYGKLRDEVLPHINVLYTVLTRTLLAEARSRTIYGQHDGALNASALSRLATGTPNIFKKRKKGKKLNTYVEVVVDQSGSMGGMKIHLATLTCIALSEALERLSGVGLKYGIVGFTCGIRDENFYRLNKKPIPPHSIPADAHNFHRIEPLVEYVYKTPDKPLAFARPIIPLMKRQDMSNNADGDTLMRIAKRVMQRKEERKIIIVLSDGQPAASQGAKIRGDAAGRYLKYVSSLIERTPGLEVIGIGINTTSVKTFYSRHAVVNRISDLPRVAMTELSDALLGKVTHTAKKEAA
ncbi:MAG: hypothetical protein LPL29_03925 [Alphaproteobacteria bacterium]|nr:hypothetical protein [Alphaproteobacteria bacterium]